MNSLCKLLILVLIFSAILFTHYSCKKEDPKDSINYGTVTDINGNLYKTVTIGSQTWMAEDLRSYTYQNGVEIPFVSEQSLWENMTSPSLCNYQTYNTKNPFGKLYNWYAVSDSQNICPTGWHVPNINDWNILLNEVGTDAAIKLKESSSNFWIEWRYENTNETGFTAVPNGIRTGGSIHNSTGYGACWWSKTSADSSNSWYIYLATNTIQALYRSEHKSTGVSVRCVKD